MGNEIAGDDGVGIYIGKRLRGLIKGWDVKCSDKAGFYLIEEMEGYDEVVLVDSLVVREGRVGEIVEGYIQEGTAGTSPHSLSISQSLSLGRALGLKIPRKVKFFAITIPPPSLGEGLSPTVKEAAEKIISLLSLL